MHFISCYEEALVDRSKFKSGADKNNGNILLPEKFTINCAYLETKPDIDRDCVNKKNKNFGLRGSETMDFVVSVNAIYGVNYTDVAEDDMDPNPAASLRVDLTTNATPDWADDDSVVPLGDYTTVITNSAESPISFEASGKIDIKNNFGGS